MAVSISKKKSKFPKRLEPQELGFFDSLLAKLLFRVPTTALLLLIVIFLWSSSTTIFSGNIVHVCVSSRKLNNLYCLSAGTQPNFEIPIPTLKNTSIDDHLSTADTKQVVDDPNVKKGSFGNLEEPIPPLKNASTDVHLSNADIKQVVEKGILGHLKDGEEGYNVKAIKELLQIHRSWGSNSIQATCNGRGIYVYDLPPKFNKDLMGQCGNMIPWLDFCKYFTNEALGEPIPELGKGWYHTHQYSLEPIFHYRVLKHPCRVYNENEAKLFYVPYYGGLDILRWHFRNVSNEVKDGLALELVNWLESQSPWAQNSGKDHVLILGKISWDFRRYKNTSWGTRFLQLEQCMQNPIKLLIERQPWEINEIGIPHPTYFHPHTDDDIVAWQLKIIRSHRKSLGLMLAEGDDEERRFVGLTNRTLTLPEARRMSSFPERTFLLLVP
ncbi:root hair specific 8 [Actinidia rufa]|uniref:Root hair specific 8 n=1 Tax=Actinidia rufa TaxID=165716 RepID=A0A7J0FTY0_9ERIC|nr:root hair specific 8 [Actinidia rufa]